MNTPEQGYTAEDWDKVRMGFHTSIMVDTSLNSLAQNLDSPPWPLSGPEETPAKYVDLTLDELQRMPGFAGHPERIQQLISILEETLAFDNPFGEMVDQTAVAAEKDNPLLKCLSKLEIPADFPIERTALSSDSKELCRLEKIVTLGDFAVFARNMPPSVVVGGDFRRLLNALAHVNEAELAALLPFRPGQKGLHLLESLAQLVGGLPEGELLALSLRFGANLSPEEKDKAEAVDSDRLDKAEAGLRERAAAVASLFPEEMKSMEALRQGGATLERQVVVLGNPRKEAVVVALLKGLMPESEDAGEPRRGGFLGLLTRWFRSK